MAQSHKKEHQDYRQRQEDDTRKMEIQTANEVSVILFTNYFFIALKQVKSPKLYVFELNKDQK